MEVQPRKVAITGVVQHCVACDSAGVAHLLEAVGASSVIALQEEGEEGGQMLAALPLHSLKPFHTPPHLNAQTQCDDGAYGS